MKKVTYLLALVFALTLMSFSCTKEEDEPVVPPTEHPTAYITNWRNDFTELNGVENGTVQQYSFNLTNTVAIVSGNPGTVDNEFDSWKVSGTTLTLIDPVNELGTWTLTVTYEPNGGEMILQRVVGDDTYTYHLSK